MMAKEDAMFITTDEMLRPGFCGVVKKTEDGASEPVITIDMSHDAKLVSGAKMEFPEGFANTYEEGDSLWVFSSELATDLVNKDILSSKGWFYGADGRLYTFNKESNFKEFCVMLEDTYSGDIRSLVVWNREAQAEENLALLKLLVGNDKSNKALLLSEATIEYGRGGKSVEDNLLGKYTAEGLSRKELKSAFRGIRNGRRFHRVFSLVGRVLLVLILVLMAVVSAHMLVK